MARQKAYTISIPKPCHENWETMTQTEKGKFCGACQKNVINFTKLSDKEIIKLIEQSNGGICGRVSSSQVNREMYVEKYNTIFPLRAQIITSLLALATLQPVISHASEKNQIELNIASNKIQHAELFIPVERLEHDTTKYTINGVVVSEENQPIPFANVLILGTSRGTVTDINGQFSLVLSERDVLIVSSVGYPSKQINIHKSDILTSPLIILLKFDTRLQGDVIIVKSRKDNNGNKGVIKNPTEAQINFLLNNNR